MFAFSTCWNSHRHTDGRAMLAEIRALGFEYAELGHGIRLSLFDGIYQAVTAGEIKISSLHNFCPLPLGVMGPAPDYYLPSATRERERQQAVRHTLRTLEFAAGVGARAVVLHLGLVPMRGYTMRLLELFAEGQAETTKFYRLRDKACAVRARKRAKYFDQVCRTLEELVPRARELQVRLGLETRFGIEEIPSADETAELLARFGADVVGYWHDVGHAQIKEQLGLHTHEALLKRFRGQTAGMHLQDFRPPAFDHRAPGTGEFDFARLAPFVTPDMVLAWEVHPRAGPDDLAVACRQAHDMLWRSSPS